MAKKSKENKPVYDVNWYDDKYQSIVVFRNWLLIITFLAVVGILLMTAASYYFVPLKSVSPFVVQIDEKSGMTQVVDTKTATEFTSSEVLIKFFAMEYINAHENYNYLTLATNNNLISLMSTNDILRAYVDQLYNKQYGYYVLYGAQTTRTISPLYVHQNLNKTTGETQINASFEVRELSSSRKPMEYNISITMTCHFDASFKLSEEQRLVNPLGFIVTSYQSVKETQPDVQK